jgi:hypothetical protein
MTGYKALGKRRKGAMKRLEEELETDPVWQEEFGETPAELSFLKLEPCDKAVRLVEGIYKNYQMSKNGELILQQPKQDNDITIDYPQAVDNALLALCHIGLKQKEKAERIAACIEEEIGRHETGLFLTCFAHEKTKGLFLEPAPSLAMAMVYFGLGNMSEARQIMQNVKKNFRFSNKLITEYADTDRCNAFDHMLYVLASYCTGIKDSSRLLERYEVLFNQSNTTLDIASYFASKALYATALHWHLGKETKAAAALFEIRVSFSMKTAGDSIMVWNPWNDKIAGVQETAALAIAYMAKQYCENERTR